MKAFRVPLALLVVLMILAGIAYWDDEKTRSEEEGKKQSQLLLPFKTAEVTALHYQHHDKEKGTTHDLVVERRDKGWQVTSPLTAPADEATISTMLSQIAEYQYEKKIEGGAKQLAEFGLDQPTVTMVIKMGDKSHRLTFGNKAPIGYSFYMHLDESPDVYMGSQYLLTNASKTLHDFRDKRIARFAKDKLTRLEVTSGQAPTIVFTKEGTKWQYAAPKTAGDRPDNELIDAYLNSLLSQNAESFVDSPSTSMQALFAPNNKGTQLISRVLVVEDNGAKQTLSMIKSGDDVLAAYDPSKRIYRLDKEADKRFGKSYDDFLNKHVFEYDYAKIQTVTFDGQTFTKKGDKWEGMAGGAISQEALSTKVQRLLTSLELASADASLPLSDQPKDPPLHTLALSFAAGTQPEKVNMSFWVDRQQASKMLVRIDQGARLHRVAKAVLSDIVDVNQTATPVSGQQQNGDGSKANPNASPGKNGQG